MRLSQKARRGLAGGSALAALLAGPMSTSGCSSVIEGKPTAGPVARPTDGVEPTFPTPGLTPGPSPPSSPPPTAPTGPKTPAGVILLPPDKNGYVFIATKSGTTRCQINRQSVGCEAPFTNSPLQDGERTNGVNITADGTVQWVLGNLGDIPTIPIDYQTYAAQGWTITATPAGTRFTNDRTRHGMFVSIDKVNTF